MLLARNYFMLPFQFYNIVISIMHSYWSLHTWISFLLDFTSRSFYYYGGFYSTWAFCASHQLIYMPWTLTAVVVKISQIYFTAFESMNYFIHTYFELYWIFIVRIGTLAFRGCLQEFKSGLLKCVRVCMGVCVFVCVWKLGSHKLSVLQIPDLNRSLDFSSNSIIVKNCC